MSLRLGDLGESEHDLYNPRQPLSLSEPQFSICKMGKKTPDPSAQGPHEANGRY